MGILLGKKKNTTNLPTIFLSSLLHQYNNFFLALGQENYEAMEIICPM